ncbi:4Fe-4S dicluster domain-containing protein [Aquicella lusitana]|uniref:4Fe-4S dicluster protein n=1 Tax=Aquicella lusitana TaxID=254246 RepID=A0A370GNB4_9COXI|nr:4Fe-4S dicluster domain-containing protein [Aquicella lusitana]RDI43413.1 4Fe-4S dicluster protein [Aquicella lusitana]VVC73563.1 Anaerobic sulfite reductase subunit A [Aquicella lusitana]
MDESQGLFLPHDRLQDLLAALKQAGYQCMGPQVKEGAIVFDILERADQLPWGYREKQAPGHYHLEKIDKNEAFAWANGPQAIKPLLFKPKETVWRVNRGAEGKLEFVPHFANEKPLAVIGVRACDIAGMAVQDRVFVTNSQVDVRYRQRREQLFVIGVNCGYASQNCFCVSAGTGPEIKNHYDIVMTELENGFLVETGSERGQSLVESLQLTNADTAQKEQGRQRIDTAVRMQTKRIPLDNSRKLYDVLFTNLDHPRWKEVAERCLSCGNCVQVCPTCFCHSEYDEPSLDGNSSDHQREWDSCFTQGHSYMTGKIVRDDIEKRYRQWLTHKVGSWHKQFDTSGCVGCGRCVTWCPVGIDLTEELAAITGESNQVARAETDETE